MHLFIAEIKDNQAFLTEGEASHMHKVLRMQPGEKVHVTDGEGRMFSGIISSVTAKNATIDIIEEFQNFQKRNYKLEIAVAPTKQIDRIEFLLEKAIEVGLDAFIPLTTFHSERRKINKERLEKIALSAMKQSLKAQKTRIHDLQTLKEFLESQHNFKGQRFIAHCHTDLELHPIKDVINPNISYQFLIGPEGDFSKEETELAISHGYQPISLGKQRMRTETAALQCVMLAHFLHL